MNVYSDCVIAVTLERNTYVVWVPDNLKPVFDVGDQLDNFWEDCFCQIKKLEPGVYLCSIRAEPSDDYGTTIFVENIVKANVFPTQAIEEK
jgi:hypothetical protein